MIHLAYLSISDGVCVVRLGLLDGSQTQDLKQMVLHDVSDDAVLVEEGTPALNAERLLEYHLNVGDVFVAPLGFEQTIAEPKGQQVLDHLFAQVVINPVDLVLFEQRSQRFGQRIGRLAVTAEGLLNYEPRPSTMPFQKSSNYHDSSRIQSL